MYTPVLCKKDIIIIKDWTGRELFKGHYKNSKVDEVLRANRCPCRDLELSGVQLDDNEECEQCNGTGYETDFEVHWLNENDKRNVYEFINY